MLKIEDFTEETLHLKSNYEGKVIATLIHSPFNEPGRPSALYVHGFNDYFFQAHTAEEFHKQGYNFYALDLRKYGRSLLPHQHPNYCRSLTEYFEEIDLSLEIIQSSKPKEIVFIGHSTGGLIGSLYMNNGARRNFVDKLILNSPFLQFNLPKWKRLLLKPFSALLSYFAPYASQKKPLSHLYAVSIFKDMKGAWKYNTDWKPINGFPAYFKWINAVFKGQAKLQRSSNITAPILILHSDKSIIPIEWSDEIQRSDMVLNVDHIRIYGKNLGDNVSFEEVPKAIHDVFISSEGVRSYAFDRMFNWLKNN